MSAFIAIEGLDGSGKSTQIDLLTNYLHAHNHKTQFIHFPRLNEGVYGELIAHFLRGEFGDVNHVHPQLVATLFAEDRKDFAPVLRQWLEAEAVVLVDRYVLSNIAFQCAKLKDDAAKTHLREWINRFEYQHNAIPQPDFSIYLDVPFSFIEASLEQRRKRKDRAYLQDKDDIHERDYTLQRAVQREYEKLCTLDTSIHKIACVDGNHQMRSIESTHEEIVALIRQKIT